MTTSIRSLADVQALEAGPRDLLAGASNTYALLRQGMDLAPGAPALSFFLQTPDHARPFRWTYRDWLARITQTANMFRQAGVQKGDVIAFVLPNLPETHWTIWGGETAATVFAINPLLEAPMIRDLMAAGKAQWLVTLAPTPGADIWQKVSGLAAELPGLKGVFTVTPLTYLQSPLRGVLKWVSRLKTPARLGNTPVLDFHAQLKKAPDNALTFPAPQLDDIASYFCTGGTTGMPKIAVRTHRTEVANALQVAAAFGTESMGPANTYFCGLPLFHVNAQIGTGLAAWSQGAHVLLGTPQGYRGPGLIPKFWEIAETHKLTSFSGVPTVYSALLQVPRTGRDLSHLKYGVCGAAPMPVELFNRFQSEVGIKILEGYGLTEGGCVSSLNPPNGESRVGSIGVRLPWQDMRVVLLDKQGQYEADAAVEEIGAIAIKGPNLFKGYLNPAHNEGLWISRPGTDGQSETWLNTGDLGRMDAQGYFWLTGRRKELIIRGGHNIDPKMIEEPMHAHPAVALAAAVGRPDPHAGEVPVVYVQLRPGQSATPDELMAHAQQTIAERAAWPKAVLVVDALPVTAIGKIFKPALTQKELEGVCREEASACGFTLTHCEARQDPRLGTVLQWDGTGNVEGMRERLGRYTFRNAQGGAAAGA